MNKIKIEIEKVPISMNKIMRMHWAERRRERIEWEQWLMIKLSGKRWTAKKEEVYQVEIFVYKSNPIRQIDTFLGSLKLLIDAMNNLDLVWDDDEEYLKIIPCQIKVKHKKDEKTVIYFEKLK